MNSLDTDPLQELPKEEECTSWMWIGPYKGEEEKMIRTKDVPEFMRMRGLTTDDIQKMLVDKLIWRYYGTEETARQLLGLKPLFQETQ